jgi:hypothetical protein
MDAPQTEETTDVRPPPKMDGAPAEPQPKGKMPTLLGLGANDPRVSSARAAILAHEAKAAPKPVDDDSIFADDSIETEVRREPDRAATAKSGTPKSRGPIPGKAAPRPLDRPPLTLPQPTGRAAAPGTRPPPPPKPASVAPPRAGEAAPSRSTLPTPRPEAKPALTTPKPADPRPPLPTPKPADARPPLPTPKPADTRPQPPPLAKTTVTLPSTASAAKPTEAPAPEVVVTSATAAAARSDKLEPTAKLTITELLDGEDSGRDIAAAATQPPAPEAATAEGDAHRPAPSLAALSGGVAAPKNDAPSPLAEADVPARPARPHLDVARPSAEEETAPRYPRRLGASVVVPVSSLVAAGGALIVMVVGAFLAGRASAGGLGRGAATFARTGVGRAALAARDAVPPAPKPCWVAKQPVRWAPEVEKGVPFEVVATKDGGFAVGFARGAREAVGVSVEPASGLVTEQLDEPTKVDVERVTPLAAGGKAFAIALAEAGAVRGAVQLPDDRGGALGVKDGALVVMDRPDAAPATLFPLGEAGNVEALRAQSAGPFGTGLVLRRGGAIWSGWLGPSRQPAGDLAKVAGSGGAVGKPMTGWNGRELAIVFADRPSDDAAWQIRVGRAKPPALPSSTTVIALPKGGPGGDAFAPGIAGLPDGRWLLVWTEGAPGARAIRAQTLAADLSPVGDPIAVSPPAGNFGQGIVAISGEYAATVFLQKGRSSYELWGAVLQCG